VAMSANSDTLRQLVQQAIAEQPSATVTVLSSLLSVQDALGYIPKVALEEVATRSGTSVNDVWGVASFYPNFRFVPPARHSVEVCWGPTCHILGAQQLFQGLMGHLGLEGEGDTADGEFTLKLNTCLGSCPHGPVVSLEHQLAGHMTIDQLKAHLEELQVGAAQPKLNDASHRWDPSP